MLLFVVRANVLTTYLLARAGAPEEHGFRGEEGIGSDLVYVVKLRTVHHNDVPLRANGD